MARGRSMVRLIKVTLHVAPEVHLKRWILSWGKDVEVLEPKKFREDIRAEWLAALRGTGGRRERLGPEPPAQPRARRARAAAVQGERLSSRRAAAVSRKA